MEVQVSYLLSLEAVRQQASIVYKAAQNNQLTNFDFHPEKLEVATHFVADVIARDFSQDYTSIPPHGRWQHFEVGGIPRVDALLKTWRNEGCSEEEITRRIVDLFFVSVLLDAGAGDSWSFTEPGTGNTYERSEGIAVASLYMFKEGVFSGSEDTTVTGEGLIGLKPEQLALGFQTSDKNPMVGVESRTTLLNSLGSSLAANSAVFGSEGRPGNLVDALVRSSGTEKELDVKVLWNILQDLLLPTWPAGRTKLAGQSLGDAWPLSTLSASKAPADGIQPFHKLTQWLTYSLMVPFERILGYKWKNINLLTGLPEYRNGGLFYDLGVLTLKPELLKEGKATSGAELPMFAPDHDVIVEWRAMTVSLLDVLYSDVLSLMRKKDESIQLSMAQVLEAGTWKSGREIATQLRPTTKSSPILIDSDGTVF